MKKRVAVSAFLLALVAVLALSGCQTKEYSEGKFKCDSLSTVLDKNKTANIVSRSAADGVTKNYYSYYYINNTDEIQSDAEAYAEYLGGLGFEFDDSLGYIEIGDKTAHLQYILDTDEYTVKFAINPLESDLVIAFTYKAK
ncbi:MAG: hypothetical protein LBS99_04365 [Clostridiales bacterium]|jgi:hypothetical protein|nr:hypothetical protein [Clostridiales bacterium]